jgi:hypothetical protein
MRWIYVIPWSKVLLEKTAQVVKKFLVLLNSKLHCRVHKGQLPSKSETLCSIL